jgi:hypothetical protein
VAKIVPIASVAEKRVPGMFKGQIWSAFDPLTEEEMQELGFE